MNLPYSIALHALKDGRRIARKGWNGKGMYVFLVRGECIEHAIKECYGNPTNDDMVHVNDFTMLKGADGRLSAWVPSSTDQLAEDWTVL